MILRGEEIKEKAIERVAQLMCAAAITAPKAMGVNNLATAIVQGDTKDKLANQMRKLAETTGASFFSRDAAGIDKVSTIILLGTKLAPLGLPACGYCGFEDCKDNRRLGATCAFNAGDLGIAVGSAVSVAMDHRIDCRVMFTAGTAALKLKLLGDEVKIAYGIPLSIDGKNPFFDRK